MTISSDMEQSARKVRALENKLQRIQKCTLFVQRALEEKGKTGDIILHNPFNNGGGHCLINQLIGAIK